MAQIELRILAGSAEDLQETLEALGTTVVETRIIRKGEPGDMRLEPGTIHYADGPETQEGPGERQARKRRTKAEMTADAMSASRSSSEVSTTRAAPTAQTKSSGSDPFGDQLKEVAAETAGGITMDSLTALGRQVFEKVGAAQAQAILMEHGGGQKQFKTVAPEHYPALRAAFTAALEAAGE